MRYFLTLLSVIGSLFFVTALILSYTNPVWVENIAREVVRIEVERRVTEKIHHLENDKFLLLAGNRAEQHAAEIKNLQQQLLEGLPAKVAMIVADMGKLDCACREKIEESIHDGILQRRLELTRLNSKLEQSIRNKYMTVADALTREFRIFSAANGLAFILIGIMLALRKRATIPLLLPALLIFCAASITAYCYLFRQNWLHSILFSEYIGLAYFFYLLVVLAILSDIAFNKARVCCRMMTATFNALGSSIQVVPC